MNEKTEAPPWLTMEESGCPIRRAPDDDSPILLHELKDGDTIYTPTMHGSWMKMTAKTSVSGFHAFNETYFAGLVAKGLDREAHWAIYGYGNIKAVQKIQIEGPKT